MEVLAEGLNIKVKDFTSSGAIRKSGSKRKREALEKQVEEISKRQRLEAQLLNELLINEVLRYKEKEIKGKEKKIKKPSKPPTEKQIEARKKFKERVNKAKKLYKEQPEKTVEAWSKCMKAVAEEKETPEDKVLKEFQEYVGDLDTSEVDLKSSE